MKNGRAYPGPSRGPRFAFTGLIALVLLGTLVLLPVLGADHLPVANDRSAVSVGGLSDSLGPAALSNTTPCGLFAAEYPPASLPQYYANYSIMFSKVCETSPFVSLYDNLTPRTGFFIVGAGGHIGEPPNLFLAIDYTANCTNASLGPPTTLCGFTTSWMGYLSNNSVVGPYTQEYLLISTGGGPIPAGAPSSTSGLSAWLLAAVAGLVVVVGGILMVVTSRRRATLREAVLFDQETTPPESPPGPAPSSPPAPAKALSASPSETGSGEATDALDDVF